MDKAHSFLLKNNSDYKELYEREIKVINLKNFKFTDEELDFLKYSYSLSKETFGNIYVDKDNKVIKTEYKVSNKFSSIETLDTTINEPINYHSHPFSNRLMEPPSNTDMKYIVTLALKKMFELSINKKKIDIKNFSQYHLIFAPEGIYTIKLYADKNIFNHFKQLRLIEFVDATINEEFEEKYKKKVLQLNKIKKKILELQKNKKKENMKKLEDDLYDFYKSKNFKKESLLNEYMKDPNFNKLIKINNEVYDLKIDFYNKKIGISYYDLVKLTQKHVTKFENYLMKIEYLYNLSLNELKKYDNDYQEEIFKYKLISPFFFNLTSTKLDDVMHDFKVKIDSNVQELTSKEMKKDQKKYDRKKVKYINDVFNKFSEKSKIKISLQDYKNFNLKTLSIIDENQ